MPPAGFLSTAPNGHSANSASNAPLLLRTTQHFVSETLPEQRCLGCRKPASAGQSSNFLAGQPLAHPRHGNEDGVRRAERRQQAMYSEVKCKLKTRALAWTLFDSLPWLSSSNQRETSVGSGAEYVAALKERSRRRQGGDRPAPAEGLPDPRRNFVAQRARDRLGRWRWRGLQQRPGAGADAGIDGLHRPPDRPEIAAGPAPLGPARPTRRADLSRRPIHPTTTIGQSPLARKPASVFGPGHG